jgi:hypothetical protein
MEVKHDGPSACIIGTETDHVGNKLLSYERFRVSALTSWIDEKVIQIPSLYNSFPMYSVRWYKTTGAK